MTLSVLQARRGCLAALAGGVLAVPYATAASVAEAISRPAVAAARPQSAVLLAAARAGRRWVAVGERGLIIHSDDEGRHWKQAESVPVSVTRTALRFIDDRRGWAVGHGGVALSTTDGGLCWTRQLEGRAAANAVLAAARAADASIAGAERLVAEGPDKPLLDLHFMNAEQGFVVGAYNIALHTRDGGKTWHSFADRLDNPKGLHLYAIGGNGDSLYIAGEQGLLLRSDDRGVTFRRLQSPYVGSWFALSVPSADTLLVAGLRGNAFISHNRGEQWNRIEGLPPVSILTVNAGEGDGALLVNQAGQIFQLDFGAHVVRAIPVPQLPPTQGAWALGGGRLLALTEQGAVVVTPSKNSS